MDQYQDYQKATRSRMNASHIRHIYCNTQREDSRLRWYCAVTAAEYCLVGYKKKKEAKPDVARYLTVGEEAPAFLSDFIRAQSDYLAAITTHKADYRVRKEENGFGPCEFHRHSGGETCYSTGVTFEVSEAEEQNDEEDEEEASEEAEAMEENAGADEALPVESIHSHQDQSTHTQEGRGPSTEPVTMATPQPNEEHRIDLGAGAKKGSQDEPYGTFADLNRGQKRKEYHEPVEDAHRSYGQWANHGLPSNGRAMETPQKQVAVKVQQVPIAVKVEQGQDDDMPRNWGLGLDGQAGPEMVGPLRNSSALRMNEIPPHPGFNIPYSDGPDLQVACSFCGVVFKRRVDMLRHTGDKHHLSRMSNGPKPLFPGMQTHFFGNPPLKLEGENMEYAEQYDHTMNTSYHPYRVPFQAGSNGSGSGGGGHGNNGGNGGKGKKGRGNGNGGNGRGNHRNGQPQAQNSSPHSGSYQGNLGYGNGSF